MKNVHFAAESHVDRSIEGAGEFIRTNIVGTFTLLEVARGAWLSSSPDLAAHSPRFLHVTTDEVYGSLGDTGYFTEEASFDPRSPYSNPDWTASVTDGSCLEYYERMYGGDTWRAIPKNWLWSAPTACWGKWSKKIIQKIVPREYKIFPLALSGLRHHRPEPDGKDIFGVAFPNFHKCIGCRSPGRSRVIRW